jgi:hypothetical protein
MIATMKLSWLYKDPLKGRSKMIKRLRTLGDTKDIWLLYLVNFVPHEYVIPEYFAIN